MEIQGYFINLDRSVDRAAYMLSEITRLGLPIERLSAVDGAEITNDTISRLNKPANGMHALSGPEVGCFLSHKNAWHKIAEGKTNYGAVFEDDIRFSKEAFKLLSDDSWLPLNTKIVKIETTSRKAILAGKPIQVSSKRKLYKLKTKHLGGGGYIVSKSFAKTLLEATEMFSAPVDYLLFAPEHALFPQIDVWQMQPALCVQQIRSKQIFLPDGIERSGLDHARKSLKLSGLNKLKRELARPFSFLIGDLTSFVRAKRIGGTWQFIRFDDE